jgi:hypothetical protein
MDSSAIRERKRLPPPKGHPSTTRKHRKGIMAHSIAHGVTGQLRTTL